MNLSKIAQDDHPHLLQAGEHEAYYFSFTSVDGEVFGCLRTLFATDNVQELVFLYLGKHHWVHKRQYPRDAADQVFVPPSGLALKLECLKPWQKWRAAFTGSLSPVRSEDPLSVELALTFQASTPAAQFQFGTYNIREQEGQLRGVLKSGARQLPMPLLCWRDHTWGERPTGGAQRWMILIVPARFYIAVITTPDGRTFGYGRIATPEGVYTSAIAPQITQKGDTWSVADPEAGLGAWTFRRMKAPALAYVGAAETESIRDVPHPGDFMRAEMGPTRFTSPSGEVYTGFWEGAWKIA